jgi:2-dehydropantoate 2-reductase
MSYWVVGAGGIGCAIGGRLAVSDDVVFVDSWREHVEAMNRNGLRVDYPGAPLDVPVRAFHLSELDRIGSAPEVVLLAVKSYQTAETCDALLPHLAADTPIVSLQNCINEETIAEKVGDRRTIGAVVLFDGSLVGPGHALRIKKTGRLVIGELDGSDSSRIRSIGARLSSSMDIRISANIWGELWSKLTVNIMINAVSAATGLGVGELVVQPVARQLMVRLGAESISVALAQGIQLVREDLYGRDPEDFLTDPSSERFKLVEDGFRIAYQEYPNLRASMLQDVTKGRPTEIDYMNGYIVKKGEQLGIRTPLNREMVRLVREVEASTRRPDRSVIDSEFARMTDSLVT